jgi:hypothetical protein
MCVVARVRGGGRGAEKKNKAFKKPHCCWCCGCCGCYDDIDDNHNRRA